MLNFVGIIGSDYPEKEPSLPVLRKKNYYNPVMKIVVKRVEESIYQLIF